MNIIYAFESLPKTGTSALFLAGPTPRAPLGAPAIPSWRQEAIECLKSLGYQGDVLIPEPRDGWRPDYDGQVEWECKARSWADIIVFWVPRDLQTLPALTTNIEFGEDLVTGKVFYGRPDGSPKNRYLDVRYEDAYQRPPATTLQTLLTDVVDRLGHGAERTAGERLVPLWIWKTPSFQSWYEAQRALNNRLDGFQTQHVFRFGPGPDNIFGWVAKVDVYIDSEKRNKSNESVVARTDTAMVVPFLTDTPDQDVLMTQEFRSPGHTRGGRVVEPPAGSSPTSLDPKTIAAEEFNEETGFSIEPDRLAYIGTKQLAATMLSHRLHVFALKLTPQESREARQKAKDGKIFGVNPDAPNGERITLDVMPQSALLQSDADWTVVGAVMMSARALK